MANRSKRGGTGSNKKEEFDDGLISSDGFSDSGDEVLDAIKGAFKAQQKPLKTREDLNTLLSDDRLAESQTKFKRSSTESAPGHSSAKSPAKPQRFFSNPAASSRRDDDKDMRKSQSRSEFLISNAQWVNSEKSPTNDQQLAIEIDSKASNPKISAVKFDVSPLSSRQVSASTPDGHAYVDDLAMKRSEEGSWRHRIARNEQAIIHHRDSLCTGKGLSADLIDQLTAPRAESSPSSPGRPRINSGGSKDSPPRSPGRSTRSPGRGGSKQSKVQMASNSVQLLKRIKIFSKCSDQFLSLIASSAEYLHLKAGEIRDMDGSRVGVARVRPAVAIIVESGIFRIEIAHAVVDECNPGSCFGLANVLANSSSSGAGRSGVGPHAPVDFVVRAWGSCPEGHRIMMFHSVAVRNAMQECPMDHAHLQEVMYMVNSSVNTSHDFVTQLHCCESAKTAITESTTRHIFTEGEYVCQENQRNPDGLMLVRSGVIALEINDVEVRRISRGQAIGEEILFGVSRKWGVTARCTTLCDVVILQRRLFTTAVKEMQNGTTEERRESERLLLFLEGHWKEDKIILSWPLFRGFEADLLASLAHLIETRVLLPGDRVWEGGAAGRGVEEVALYVLLSGACEETTTTEQKRPGHSGATETRHQKRPLVPGACFGEPEFLGLESKALLVVKARSICMVAVLHRAVFLKAVENHPVETPQAAEITKALKEELDREEPESVVQVVESPRRGSRLSANSTKSDIPTSLIGSLPMFCSNDKRFVERLCSAACQRRFCISGQSICSEGKPASTMYIFTRGKAHLSIADIEIQDYSRGDTVNILALGEEVFTPTYRVECTSTCEFWSIAREDFGNCLEAFPSEKGRFRTLLNAPGELSINLDHNGSRLPDPCTTYIRMSTNNRSGTPNASFTLTDIRMFNPCSLEFLQWIAEHIQGTMYFANDVIVPEGGENSNLYIIRHGSAVAEGTNTGQAHLDSGSIIGEHRLLGIAGKSPTTSSAIEVSVVQILHRCIFQKALELFPDQVPHFDKLILEKIERVSTFELRKTPLFSRCKIDFCLQVEQIMKTRLVHPDSLILEVGSEEKVLRILKSGVAIVQDQEQHLKASDSGALQGLGNYSVSKKAREPTRIQAGATVNADVVLGATRSAASTVRAEQMCAIGEIDGTAFLSILQRFPAEVVPLLREAMGKIWPSEPESVHLFKGVNHHFWHLLVERSDWMLVLPHQCVVKQGGRGDLLFLLCYGMAVSQVGGITVGEPLTQGDCIGKSNFFGLTSRYTSTVRTRTVSHFLAMSGAVLTNLLQEQAAERQRFANLKVKAQAEAAEQELMLKEQATREKLRRREDQAFRGHISRERGNRGLAPLASNSSLASLLELSAGRAQEKGSGECSDWGLEMVVESGDGDSQNNVSRKSDFYELLKRRESHKQGASHLVQRMKQTMCGEAIQSLRLDGDATKLGRRESLNGQAVKAGRRGSLHEVAIKKRRGSVHSSAINALSPEASRSGSLRGPSRQGSRRQSSSDKVQRQTSSNDREIGSESQAERKLTHPLPTINHPSSTSSSFGGGSDGTASTFRGLITGAINAAAKRTRVERIEEAIEEHAGARQRAILKGRVLRMMHSGICKAGNSLSRRDLKELSQYLPELPDDLPEKTANEKIRTPRQGNRIQERIVQASAGRPPMQVPSPAVEQTLRRKYCQLSGQKLENLGAIIPSPGKNMSQGDLDDLFSGSDTSSQSTPR